MKINAKILGLLLMCSAVSCSNPPAAPAPQAEKKEEAKVARGPNDDCYLYLQFYKGDDTPIGLCMYSHTETRGIFASTACVVVLVETTSNVRHPFYGSKGHWGIEGTCEKSRVEAKLNEPQTMTTVNPISDLKAKRKQGHTIEILKDDFDVSQLLIQVTDPAKK